MRGIVFVSAFICVHLRLISPAAASGPIEPEVDGLIGLPMYGDPALEPPVTVDEFHPRLSELWLAALERPEAELRRQAAVALGRAGRDGMQVSPAGYAALIDAMTSDPDMAVRIAAAEALHLLNHAKAASAMLQVNRATEDIDLIRVTDRALADWRHEPAVEVWIQRVRNEAAHDAVRRSAMRALGDVPTDGAFEPLTAVATDDGAALALRLEAGRAAGKLLKANRITSPAASEAAAPLVAGDLDDQRIAAAMLAVNRDYAPVPGTDSARGALLGQLLDSDDATVVAAAVEALAMVDPSKLQTRFDRFAGSDDASVRLAAVRANLSVTPDDRAAQVRRLIGWLDDSAVRVRQAAREQLALLADTPQFADVVRQAVGDGLAVQGWRGLEQAALLAGTLDHEPAATRLIELLRHDRAEVRLAAAAALRQLAVADTMPALLERARELTESTGGNADRAAVGHETAQLFMLFGQSRYAPADELLRQYIPKASGFASQARAAAIYALGKIHEGQADPSLVRAFTSRFSDVSPMNPEMVEVRRFAAIGLGRMQARGALGPLRKFLTEENSSVDVGGAARWAIMQIAGEELPPLEPITREHGGWFLEPAQ